MRNEIGNEISAAATKAAPALAVTAASVSGWGVQEWMYAATIGYIVLQALYLCWKWWREHRRGEPK